MYFTNLPDHQKPGFDEELHFSQFKQHNIIFNAESSHSHCDEHVGCLSFKTVLSGQEWYGINHHQVAVRPGQFLILNDNQPYSSRIDHGEKVKVVSIFFQQAFASNVFRDTLQSEGSLLDDPFTKGDKTPEFFQTLNAIENPYKQQLNNLIADLNGKGYDQRMMDEHLIFLLRYLVQTYRSGSNRAMEVGAIKPHVKTEIYKRLCMAKDVIHSCFMDNPDLKTISSIACMSVPQLVRQFKIVFHATPFQYLNQVRLKHAAELLTLTDKPVYEITWMCGYENVSAFCRAFKSQHGVQPNLFRTMSR